MAIDRLFGTAGVDYWGQDQRGVIRLYGLGADVGAVEVGPNDVDSTVYVPLIRR